MIAHASPFPYLILFAFMMVVVAVFFYKFPVLRAISKPRNWLIYSVLLLLLSLVAYQAYDASLFPAVVSNSVNFGNSHLQTGQDTEFNLLCKNLSNREINFYLTINGVNATPTMDSQQNYVKINNTAIKIPFHFAAFTKHANQTKPISFMIDEDATEFQLTFHCPITTTGGTVGVQGKFNTTTNNYLLWAKPGPCV